MVFGHRRCHVVFQFTSDADGMTRIVFIRNRIRYSVGESLAAILTRFKNLPSPPARTGTLIELDKCFHGYAANPFHV